MHKILPPVLGLFLLGACASKPWYPFSPSMTRPGLDAARNPPEANQTEAVAGLLYALGSSILRDPDNTRDISGKCVVNGLEGTQIYTPCENVELTLTDLNGKEVNRTYAEGGTFRFAVGKNVSYKVRLKSKKYSLNNREVGPLHAGDAVTIALSPQNGSPAR